MTVNSPHKRGNVKILIFLVGKRDGRVKSRGGANGSTQQSSINKDDAASQQL
jgi:hypothetical protein